MKILIFCLTAKSKSLRGHHNYHHLPVDIGLVLDKKRRCLLKTSPESNWHCQDTTALSTRTRLSLPPWRFFHGLLLPHLPFLLSHLLGSLLTKLTSCLVLPSLSICVTSLLLFVLSVLFFLSLSCSFFHCLDSLCSQCVASADNVVVVSWVIVYSCDSGSNDRQQSMAVTAV